MNMALVVSQKKGAKGYEQNGAKMKLGNGET